MPGPPATTTEKCTPTVDRSGNARPLALKNEVLTFVLDRNEATAFR